MALKLDGRNPLAYMGVRPVTPPQLVVQYRQPTANDIQNFSLGTMWVIPNQNSGPTEEVWVLVDMAANVATWAQVFPQATPGGAVDSLTGDSGGAVGPDIGGNINILGTAGNVTVTGNPGTNTLTINIAGEVATTFDTDAGTATPNLGIINIIGGTNITTSGAGNTITIDSQDTVAEQFTTDTGVSVPSSGNLFVLGGDNCVTDTSAADEITINVPLTIIADVDTTVPVNGIYNAIGGSCVTTVGDNATNLTIGLSDDAGDGKIPIGRATGATAFANITSLDGSIVVTNGTNSIDISSSGGAGGTTPFFAYNDISQSDIFPINSSAYVAISFPSVLFNVGNNYDSTSSTFTAPVSGYYYFKASGCVLAPSQTSSLQNRQYYISIITSTQTFQEPKQFYTTPTSDANIITIDVFCFLSVGETASVAMRTGRLAGAPVYLEGTPVSQPRVYFSGYLVAP